MFILNSKGELLLQQRAHHKYHSGGLWTNTCCSHPRDGEDILDAGIRRLQEDDLKKNYLINRNKEKLIVNNGNKKNNEIESNFGLTYSQIKENNKSEETKIIASSITKATKQITRKFTYRLMNNHIWQSVSPVPPNKISYFKKR